MQDIKMHCYASQTIVLQCKRIADYNIALEATILHCTVSKRPLHCIVRGHTVLHCRSYNVRATGLHCKNQAGCINGGLPPVIWPHPTTSNWPNVQMPNVCKNTVHHTSNWPNVQMPNVQKHCARSSLS